MVGDTTDRQPPIGRPRGVQAAARRAFGEDVLDWLVLAGAQRQHVLEESLAYFTEVTDLPPWDLVPGAVVEIGGDTENDLRLLNTVRFGDARGWQSILRDAVPFEFDLSDVGVHYIVRRVFDPGVTDLVDKPVLRFEAMLVLIIYRNEPARRAAVLTVGGRDGPALVFDGDVPEGAGALDFPLGMRDRVPALVEHLVGVDQEGRTVYIPFTDSARADIDPIRVATSQSAPSVTWWESVEPGTPELHIPPYDAMPPRGSDSGLVEMALTAGSVALPPSNWNPLAPKPGGGGGGGGGTSTGVGSTTVSGATGVSTTTDTGTKQGYGPPETTAFGFWQCNRMDTQASCKACCGATAVTMYTAIARAAAWCHGLASVCICCHAVCGLVEGAAAGVVTFELVDCLKNCDRQTSWNPA
jgi:hypothetical protein